MDKITLQRLDQLDPRLIEGAKKNFYDLDHILTGRAICRAAYTRRTFQEQNDLYAQGRTKLFDATGKRLGIVTWAKGGESYHNYGLALDIVLLIDKDGNGTYEAASWDTEGDYDGDKQSDWMEVVKVFKADGWEWGGDWKKPKTDSPHFQKTFGLSIADLKKLHNVK